LCTCVYIPPLVAIDTPPAVKRIESCEYAAILWAASTVFDPGEVMWAIDSGPVLMVAFSPKADDSFTKSSVSLPLEYSAHTTWIGAVESPRCSKAPNEEDKSS
jgi:hypothetical protein